MFMAPTAKMVPAIIIRKCPLHNNIDLHFSIVPDPNLCYILSKQLTIIFLNIFYSNVKKSPIVFGFIILCVGSDKVSSKPSPANNQLIKASQLPPAIEQFVSHTSMAAGITSACKKKHGKQSEMLLINQQNDQLTYKQS